MTAATADIPTWRFDAFISYRRKDGGWHATNLRRRLLEAPIPRELAGNTPRRLSIYLDTIYERATEDFFEHTIKPALAASRHLIVIQSGSALTVLPGNRPNWLVREIEYFLGLPPEGRSSSVVITSANVDAALPGNLHSLFPNIERLDLSRWRWYRPAAADDAVLTLAATLLDIPADRMPLLRQEDAKRQARRWRIRAITASALAIVLIGLFALLAVVYSRSEERRRVATSRLLAIESGGRLERRIDEALGLAVHAYAIEPTIEAESAVLDALRRSPLLERVLYGARGQIQRIATSRDGRFVAALDNAGALTVWNIKTSALVGQHIIGPNVLLEAVDFDRDGDRLFSGTPDGQIDVWAISNGRLEHRDSIPNAGIIQALRVSPDGTVLVTGDLTGDIRIRDVARLRESRSLGRHRSGVTSISIGNGLVVTGALDGSVTVQRLDGSERRTIEAQGKGIFGVALEDSGRYLIAGDLDGRVLQWTLADLVAGSHELAKVPGRILSLAASATASVIAVGLADGNVSLHQAHGAEVQQLGGHADRVRGLAVTADGSRLFAGASDGRVLVWRPLGPENLVTRLFAHRSPPQAVQFDARGDSIVSADLSGTVVAWPRGGGTVAPRRVQPRRNDQQPESQSGRTICGRSR